MTDRQPRRVLLAATSLAALALAMPAVAQETALAEGPVTQVDDIVVTASGYEQRIVQAPASISVLPREEIEELRAASIAEILNNVEGVDTGAGVGKTGGQTINIRGMGSDYTLILIDGRRQNTAGSVTPNGFGETANGFLPPISAIDRIEVVRGPVSTLYGSDAMGGVINIITRRVGEEWGGSAGANYTLQGDDEFGNLWGLNGYASGPLVDNLLGLALRGSWAEREQSDLTYRDVNGNEVAVTGFGRSATAYENWTLGARLSLTAHPDHDLWLDVDAASQWYDNAEGQMGTNTTAGGYADFLEFNREQYLLAHDWRLPFGELQSTLSRNVTETLGRIIPNGVPGAGGPRTLETTTDLFETRLHVDLGAHNLSVGGQYMDAEMIDGVATGNFAFDQWALFAEDEWRLTDSLALTLGLRYDEHSSFGDHLSPRAYVVWNATDEWTIKGGVAAGYKTPRLEQLTPGINGFGRQGTLPLIGTPTLTPETSVSSEIGVYYDNGVDLRGSVTIFRNDFQDKIASGQPVDNCTFGISQADYDAGSYSTTDCADVGFWPGIATFGQSVNIDEATTQGLEAVVRWSPAPDWTVSANYTYTESEQETGASAGQPLTDTPEHMLNGQVRWDVNERLTAWVRGEYRSERWRGEGAARDALGDFEAYTLAHVGGSYAVSDRVTVNATIYNLFDTDFVRLEPYGTPVAYSPEYANNQEPRRLYLGVNVDF